MTNPAAIGQTLIKRLWRDPRHRGLKKQGIEPSPQSSDIWGPAPKWPIYASKRSVVYPPTGVNG